MAFGIGGWTTLGASIGFGFAWAGLCKFACVDHVLLHVLASYPIQMTSTDECHDNDCFEMQWCMYVLAHL